MNTAIIAAIVAGIISLIGFLVNIYISREARKNTISQITIASRLKDGENSIFDMKQFLSASENLRFTCVRLLKILTNDEHDSEDDVQLELLSEFADAYQTQQKSLFDAWFKIIMEIRNPVTLNLGTLMHDGNNICAAVSGYLSLLLLDLERQDESCRKIMNKRYRVSLSKSLHLLIRNLEQLNSLMISERDELMRELWRIEPPNKALQRTDDRRR